MILSLSGHRNELDGGNKEEDALFFEHKINSQYEKHKRYEMVGAELLVLKKGKREHGEYGERNHLLDNL